MGLGEILCALGIHCWTTYREVESGRKWRYCRWCAKLQDLKVVRLVPVREVWEEKKP